MMAEATTGRTPRPYEDLAAITGLRVGCRVYKLSARAVVPTIVAVQPDGTVVGRL
jgi:hypothetical protein